MNCIRCFIAEDETMWHLGGLGLHAWRQVFYDFHFIIYSVFFQVWELHMHAMQFLSTSFETAVHHWFTCIRDVFFKNFTPVKWMLHPQACRLLLFVASPMGISESFRVNMSLSETVAPSKTDQNIEMRHLFWFSGLAKSTSELLPVCHHYIPLHWKELQKLIDQ